MYLRKTTRRRLQRASLLMLALVLLAPKVDLQATPQLAAAVFPALGLGKIG